MNKKTIAMTVAAAISIAAIPAAGDERMLQTGMPFPAFELPAHDGTTVTSTALTGTPFLLFFYPKADTGG
jgi:cytochrome oxidase Cu insertion factor (SCO1/SenC/PrrC family)